MGLFSRLLALRLFEAHSIQRWNDRIRSVDLTEMDKQAFKSVLTYFFAKLEEEKGEEINWEYLVYGSLFALLKNVALSDIKAPVIRKIKTEYHDAFKELNGWVVEQYHPIIEDKELLSEFERFMNSDDDESNINLRILRAAHKFSTLREFEIIKAANSSFPQLSDLEKEVRQGVERYKDLEGVQQMLLEGSFFEGICLIEQLRFQTRWSQTPRIPKTTVLGHCMLVACLMVFLSRQLDACSSRLCNNFYAGLFHDLPEAVVRDIISPVKRATAQLPAIIKKIEVEVCESELYPKFPEYVVNHLKYLLGNGTEFADRIMANGAPRPLTENENINDYNHDEYSPVDGKLLKVCDEIVAFIEADQSIKHGVTSRHLQDGMANIRSKYIQNKKPISGIDVQRFFLEFD